MVNDCVKSDRGKRNGTKKSVRSCKLTPNILAQKVMRKILCKKFPHPVSHVKNQIIKQKFQVFVYLLQTSTWNFHLSKTVNLILSTN